ncbi:galactonate dehydratase [Halococcus agarilyticus]|uniref:galactonate dehydratase n=1 Tax=Halococcus agarilyticus TaxID=1232219 RepID=UPI000677CB88|nr:galactonate dehydratase [Halococcus agarilyticus]
MNVSDYELYYVPPGWTFLKLVTSDGTVGWGEATLSSYPSAVEGAVRDLLERTVLDIDTGSVRDIWEAMYRGSFYRGGPVLMTAIAGIDQALWDIKGKQCDLPVYELLGGAVRESIPAYQWVHGKNPRSPRGADPESLAEDAAEQVAAGFSTLKLMPLEDTGHVVSADDVRRAVERLDAVREAVGPSVDVALDFHGRVSAPAAKRLVDRMDAYDPLFVEEPVLPEHTERLPEIAAATTTPIAVGERIHSREGFSRAFDGGGVDVAQPDLSHVGGITEAVRIAELADARDVALAPHCPLGPIALASSLHVDAVSRNATVQEQVIHKERLRDVDAFDYVANPGALGVTDGAFDLPEASGLGVELDEEVLCERARENPTESSPVFRRSDGSVGET